MSMTSVLIRSGFRELSRTVRSSGSQKSTSFKIQVVGRRRSFRCLGSSSSSSSSSTDDSSSSSSPPQSSTASASGGSKEQHRMFLEQMKELGEEREALFGFTEDDHNAWSGGSHKHKHDSSFLQQVEYARFRAQHQTSSQVQVTETTEVHPYPGLSEDADAAGEIPSRRDHLDLDDDVDHPSTRQQRLSHVSIDGRSVQMVDIGAKVATQRIAVAQSKVVFPPQVISALKQQQQQQQQQHQSSGSSSSASDDELIGTKGPIFATAKLSGIMAAK